jgi:hypothetical protein
LKERERRDDQREQQHNTLAFEREKVFFLGHGRGRAKKFHERREKREIF